MPRRFLNLLLVCLPLLLMGQAPAATRPNILLISLDTLRADHLSCYGYERETSPHLDKLAKRSHVFRQAFSHSDNTIVSHASMLTSWHPVRHAVDRDIRLSEEIPFLPEILRDSGYQTAGFTAHATWLNEKMGFARGFDQFNAAYQAAPERNQMILEWMGKRGKDKPLFLFLHYYDVHSDWDTKPYDTKSKFDRKFAKRQMPRFQGCRDGVCASELLRRADTKKELLSDEEVEWIKGLYDGGIAYMDHHLLQALNGIRQHLDWDNTWVIITSDHGEEFREHGRLLHNNAYREVAQVPLIIHPPGGVDRRDLQDVVGLVDLMPTILDIAGVEGPAEMEGVSLRPLFNGEAMPPRTHYFKEYDASTGVTLRDDEHTLVTRLAFTQLELYDRLQDPDEHIRINAKRPNALERMLNRGKDFYDQQLRDQATSLVPAEITPEEEERLRSLGYIR